MARGRGAGRVPQPRRRVERGAPPWRAFPLLRDHARSKTRTSDASSPAISLCSRGRDHLSAGATPSLSSARRYTAGAPRTCDARTFCCCYQCVGGLPELEHTHPLASSVRSREPLAGEAEHKEARPPSRSQARRARAGNACRTPQGSGLVDMVEPQSRPSAHDARLHAPLRRRRCVLRPSSAACSTGRAGMQDGIARPADVRLQLQARLRGQLVLRQQARWTMRAQRDR